MALFHMSVALRSSLVYKSAYQYNMAIWSAESSVLDKPAKEGADKLNDTLNRVEGSISKLDRPTRDAMGVMIRSMKLQAYMLSKPDKQR